jgi:hypothetical protein
MPARTLGTIATADVVIQAQLDAFDRDLTVAQQKVTAFGQQTTVTTATVDKLSASSKQAAAAAQQFGSSFDKAATASKHFSTASTSMAAANDNTGRSFIKSAEHILSVAGALKLVSTVAYSASPTFAKAADSFLGIAKAGLESIPISERVAQGFRKTMEAIRPAATLTPVAKAAGTAVLGIADSVLTFASRIALPIVAVVTAFKALVALFKLGQSTVANFNREVNAAAGAVSIEALHRYTDAMGKVDVSVESATELFKKLQEVTRPALGEQTQLYGQLQKTLHDLTSAGNFAGLAAVKMVQQATTAEQRFAALAKLITDASAKGERLAALKLAESFLPPAMLMRLRQMPDLLDQVVRTPRPRPS